MEWNGMEWNGMEWKVAVYDEADFGAKLRDSRT